MTWGAAPGAAPHCACLRRLVVCPSGIDPEGLRRLPGALAVAGLARVLALAAPAGLAVVAGVGRLAGLRRLLGLVGGRGVDADGIPDLLADLEHQVEVLGQELLRLLAALTELLPFVGEPRTRFLDDAEIDADVEQRAFAADALAVHDVELGLTERRRHLVLRHLDPGPVADDLGAVLDRLHPPDVETHRRVELQRPTARRRLRAAEHHADLLPQLVDEDADRPGAVEVGRELPQRLAHEPGLEADVRVAHLALDLGPRHQRRHRVDDDHVERAGADEHVGDLERLLTGVGLADQELVDVDADGGRVHRVHGVLGVHVRADATVALRLGHHVHGQRGLPRRLGAEHLDHPTPGQAPDAERDVEGERAGRDGRHPDVPVRPEAHDGALAELLLDLAQRQVECLVVAFRTFRAFHAFHDGTLHLLLLHHSLDAVRTGESAVRENLRRGYDNNL